MYKVLEQKISNLNARIGVIGLGYVGLPLSFHLSRSGFTVTGMDVSTEKISMLKKGKSYIIDVEEEQILSLINEERFLPTTDFSSISNLDVVCICVPTPLTENQQPDMSYIKSSVNSIKEYMHKGLLIILESTTYPGTTEELIMRPLEEIGYKVGVDYFLCFSPERVDPGNKLFNTQNTPKVIGGVTSQCTELGVLFYGKVMEKVVPVSSTKVAEMSKLLENTFRSINIAFINEMALLCDRLGISIWETIDAANSKPFGFMPFYPGPGIGGHCIPLDPMYLSWKAKEKNFFSRFIELAQEINKSMPNYVTNKITYALNQHGRAVKGANILILGMAYKPDIDDLRESPSLEIYNSLVNNGASVDYNDPYIESFYDFKKNKKTSVPLSYESFLNYDCVVLLTKHSDYDMSLIEKYSLLIVDTRNGLKGIDSDKVFRIGDSTPEIFQLT